MKNTVLFDLDGTLLNTLEDLADSTNYALAQCGFAARSTEEIRCFVGNGIHKLIERAVPQGTAPEALEACYDIFCAHYKTNMENKTAPYSGIAELLAALAAAGFKMAIVTNKADFAAQALCTRLFGAHIQTIVGSVPERPNKPEPDGVEYALQCLGAQKQEAVYVGDSEVDVATAANAQLDCIGVLWGFRTRADLQKAGATVLVETPEELNNLLLSLKK